MMVVWLYAVTMSLSEVEGVEDRLDELAVLNLNVVTAECHLW